MKKKAIVAALLLFAVGFGAFADVGVYIKGAVGYEFLGYGDLAVKPTVGISPWLYNDSAFLENLSFEASVDIGFGDNITVISPGVMAVFNHQLFAKFAFRYGLGVSFPITMFGSDYIVSSLADTIETGFGVDLMFGMAFSITDKIIPTLDLELTFGDLIPDMGVKVGVMYKFGGGGRKGSSASQIAPQDLPPAPENFSYFGTWRSTSNPRETLVIYDDGLAVLQVEGEEPVVGTYRANDTRWGQRLRFRLSGMKNTDLLYSQGVGSATSSTTGALYRYSGSLMPTSTPVYDR